MPNFSYKKDGVFRKDLMSSAQHRRSKAELWLSSLPEANTTYACQLSLSVGFIIMAKDDETMEAQRYEADFSAIMFVASETVHVRH